MKVRVKRVDKNLPLPTFETKGSVGFDLIAREDTVVEYLKPCLIPANVIVEVPKGYMLQISLRSSAPRKHGLIMPHGVGVVDTDYCGDKDELMIQVQRNTVGYTEIKRGDKIAQGVFVKIENEIVWDEVDSMKEVSRGGFGSTDQKERENEAAI